jgi:uncharacterized protein (DUF427 family)
METPERNQNNGPGYARAPNHLISIHPATEPVVIRRGGAILCETSDALILNETNYPEITYVPANSITPGLLVQSSHTTYCPFKGQATYWSYEGQENIAWSYNDPYDEVLEIKEHLAFYRDKIDPP